MNNKDFVPNIYRSNGFLSVSGTVMSITNMSDDGCSSKMYQVEDAMGSITNFIVTPQTYFVDFEKIYPGMEATFFYDAGAPVPLIYPPQFNAVVVASDEEDENVMVGRFGANLVSQDRSLKLIMSPSTEIELTNGQPFNGSFINRDIVVVYGATTRSIPPQTTPEKIVVLCR